VQPEEFFDRLTPRGFSALLEKVLAEGAGSGPLDNLRLLYERRLLRFGSIGTAPPPDAAHLFRRWLRTRLTRLDPDELDMTRGVRLLFERLGLERVLRQAWWRRLHLEVPLDGGGFAHWLLEHRDGAVLRCCVLLQRPEAELGLRLGEEDLVRLYTLDGRTGLALLTRAARVLRRLELVRGRRKPRPFAVLRLLRDLLA
jgi:hypothetical protein